MVAAERALLDSRWAIEHLSRPPDEPLERVLARSLSRRADQRQASVLELVRELQQVETEIGAGQTPIEVAVDDWALATVTDLEED